MYRLQALPDSDVRDLGCSLHWYALYTRHQHEKTVARILTDKGFEILLPLYSTVRTWKDRRKRIFTPLFPCYVFLRGSLSRRLDIITTPGIHALVSNGGQPAIIPSVEIDGIKRAVEEGTFVEPHPFLKCGEWVRVKCGPLAGIEGILVRKKNVYRLVLSIAMLGRAAAVEIDRFMVERLNSTQVAFSSVPAQLLPEMKGGSQRKHDHLPIRYIGSSLATRSDHPPLLF